MVVKQNVKRHELAPYGISKFVHLFLYFVCGVLCGQIVTCSGLMTLFPVLDTYSWDDSFRAENLVSTSIDDLNEADIVAVEQLHLASHIQIYKSIGHDVMHLLFAAFAIFSDLLTKRMLFILLILFHTIGSYMIFYSGNTRAVDFGIVIGSCTHVVYVAGSTSIFEIFPTNIQFILACSLITAANDISMALPSLIVMASDYTGIEMSTIFFFTVVVGTLLCIMCAIVTPASWSAYVDPNRYQANLITFEELQLGQSMRPRKTREHQKSTEDPRDVSFLQSLKTGASIVFIFWICMHYVRLRKLLEEVQAVIVQTMGNELGKTDAEKNAMILAFNFAILLGPIFNLVFSYVSTFMRFSTSLMLLNGIFLASQMLLSHSWKGMYMSAIIVGGASTMMICLIPMMLQRFFNLKILIQHQALICFLFGICGIIANWIYIYVSEEFDYNSLQMNEYSVWFAIFCFFPLFPLTFFEIRQEKKVQDYKNKLSVLNRSLTKSYET